VVELIEGYISDGGDVWTIRQLQEWLKDHHDVSIKAWTLRKLVRNVLNMRYRRI